MDELNLMFLMEEEYDEEDQILLLSNKRKKCNNLFLSRKEEGTFQILIERRLFSNESQFQQYFRLSLELFETVSNAIQEDLVRTPYNRHKEPISPKEKLCITLRYLATGESFRSLAFQYRVHYSWISIIVKEVLKSICNRMLHTYIPVPTEEQLKQNAEEFFRFWNYPNCCAAIDGKHIRIVCPNNAGSLYYNYKNFHSVVLLALVDAKCRYVAIDTGSYGREGDAGIFMKSTMGNRINSDSFKIPPPQFIPGTSIKQPHVILGDEAFSLTVNMMKPYPKSQSTNNQEKAIYNYRHSRARRTTENTFGIMCQYFRIFFTPIAILPNTVDDLIVASCILHNMLRNSKIPFPGEGSIQIKLPTDNMKSLAPTQARRSTFAASVVRDNFMKYFNSNEGSVSWQNSYVNRTN